MKNNYANDSQFADHIHKISALAFLQPAYVAQTFDGLYSSLLQILKLVMNYFEDTYINRRQRNGRATPRFLVD